MKAAKIINNISIEKEHDTENYQGKKCFLPQFHKYFFTEFTKKNSFLKEKNEKKNVNFFYAGESYSKAQFV